MRANPTTTALVLVLGWLPAAAAVASDLPAQAQRIWGPTGDEIGLANHAAIEFLINDDHGDQAKAAEDWALLGKSSATGLFNYQRRSERSHLLVFRGNGGNREGSGLAGDFSLASTAPGLYGARFTYSAHDLYYDRDSEMRAPAFVYPPPPPALAFTPHLSWQRAVFACRYQLNDGLQIQGGVSDLRRDGRKASLLRGGTAASAPQVQTVDTRVAEIWVGGAYGSGPLACELRLSCQASDDIREYADRHAHDAERKLYRIRLAAAYDLSPDTRLLMHGGLSRLELLGREGWGAGRTAASDGDAEIQVGQLAVMSRLGQATTLRAAARFAAQQSDIRFDEGADILYAADRTGNRQDYRLVIDDANLPDTRVRLQYRLSKSSREDMAAQGDRPVWLPDRTQGLDQESTRHDLALRSRTRLGRQTRLKLGLEYTNLDVSQDRTARPAADDPWYGILGDHKRSRLAWDAALQLRPRRNLPLDVGYQGRDQTFERTTGDGAVETTWLAHRLFANVNWLAERRLTVYGMISYGKETYELTGVNAPAGTMGAFDYEGATLRFMPGAVLQLSRAFQLEGMLEMVRYENESNESARLDPVKADSDRTLLRLRWQATGSLAAAVTYRRHEFDENRWDDYIQDLYAVSVSGFF